MPVNSDFRDAVQNKNVLMVRIMMKDSLILDPTFAEFDAMTREAEHELGAKVLYDKHDGARFDTNESNWDKKYLDEQIADLMSNFSRERISHVRKICSVIYAEEIENIKRKRHEKSRTREHVYAQDQDNDTNRKFWGIMFGFAGVTLVLILIWWLFGDYKGDF